MTAAIGMGLAVGWVLALGCVVDKLLARIPAVERYIERLPLGRERGYLQSSKRIMSTKCALKKGA